MNTTIYQPRTDIVAKLRRRAARYVGRRTVTPDLERGIVSFSFDDCPRSVVDNALPLLEARGWTAPSTRRWDCAGRPTIWACT